MERKYLIRRAVVCFILFIICGLGAWEWENTRTGPGWLTLLSVASLGGALWNFPPTGAVIQPWVRRRQREELLRRPIAKLPEVALFPDEETRAGALREVEKRTAGAFITVSLTMISMFFVIWLDVHALRRLGVFPLAVREAITTGLIFASIYATWFGLQALYAHRRQKLLRQRLLALGVPVCLACGYDLRALTEPRCPECGAAFDQKLLAGTAAESAKSFGGPGEAEPRSATSGTSSVSQ